MTTSDPVLYPIPLGTQESLRQDAVRTRVELADTVETLISRLDIRRQAQSATASAAAVLGACAVGFGTLAVTRLVGHRGHEAAGQSAPWWRGRIMTSLGAGIAGAAAYTAIRRRTARPEPSEASMSTDPAPEPRLAPAAAESDGELVGGDVVDVLMFQHRQVAGLVARVRTARGSAKRQAFATLVDFLNQHEASEQEIVHPVLRGIDEQSAEVVAGRLREEEDADLLIASLVARGVDHPEFSSGLADLIDAVQEHAAHEEEEEFPLLRARVPAEQLRAMASRVRVVQSGSW